APEELNDMAKHFTFMRLALLLTLIASLTLVPFALAQEGEGETTTEESAAAAESEAQEVGGEEEGHAEVAAEEAAEAGSPLAALGINTGYLLAQIINFGLIALLLG